MSNSESDYEKQIFGSLGGKIVSAVELMEILKCLELKNFTKILDVGTGTGRIARAIIRVSESHVIGIDVNKHNVKHAKIRKRILKDHADRYDLIIADGQFLPFKNSLFDYVICIRTLKYFPNYQLGIQEMSRVLKDNGIMVLTLSNVLSVDFFLHKLRILAYRTLFNFRRMSHYFNRNNLTIIEYLGLHKIHPKIWTISRSLLFITFLRAAELVLQKITPKEFFSREILVKLVKSKN